MDSIEGARITVHKVNLPPTSPIIFPIGEKLRLTGAVVSKDPYNRPLAEGYRIDSWHCKTSGLNIPVLAIATHSDKLIDVFEDFIDAMGGDLGLVLETSHNYPDEAKHDDLFRYGVDPWFIKHILHQYEDLFLNDGFTGIAVLNNEVPEEIQFDEHKCLFVYSQNLERFIKVLEEHGISYDQELHLITEANHLHVHKNEKYQKQFEELARDADVSIDPDEDEDNDEM